MPYTAAAAPHEPEPGKRLCRRGKTGQHVRVERAGASCLSRSSALAFISILEGIPLKVFFLSPLAEGMVQDLFAQAQ